MAEYWDRDMYEFAAEPVMRWPTLLVSTDASRAVCVLSHATKAALSAPGGLSPNGNLWPSVMRASSQLPVSVIQKRSDAAQVRHADLCVKLDCFRLAEKCDAKRLIQGWRV